MTGRTTLRVLLAAGGTGGHLFPAEALAGELLSRGTSVELATDSRGRGFSGGLAKIPVHRISAGGIAGKGLVHRWMNACRLFWGFQQALWLVTRTRPDCVVGFGGYASLPTVLAAQCLGRPTILHEQNAVMGRANRFLMNRARLVALAFNETRHAEKLEISRRRHVGNPVRASVIAVGTRAYVAPDSGSQFHLFVMGGSQGARAFANLVPEAIKAMAEPLRARLMIAQQCRAEDLQETSAIYRSMGIEAELKPFFDDVSRRLEKAHLVISRAGASSVAELAAAARPAILVPLPGSIDDHQVANANAFERAGGGWVIAQAEGAARLSEKLSQLMASPEMLARAANLAMSAGRTDAAARLADAVSELSPTKAIAKSLEILV